MKKIIQKLKTDAQAFTRQANKANHMSAMHKNIMDSVVKQNIHSNNKTPSIKSFFRAWPIPTGIVVAIAISLIVIRQQPAEFEMNKPNAHDLFSIVHLTTLDINKLPENLENQLTKQMKAEQQALNQDIVHLKSLFVL